jgi:hypothetical protein
MHWMTHSLVQIVAGEELANSLPAVGNRHSIDHALTCPHGKLRFTRSGQTRAAVN